MGDEAGNLARDGLLQPRWSRGRGRDLKQSRSECLTQDPTYCPLCMSSPMTHLYQGLWESIAISIHITNEVVCLDPFQIDFRNLMFQCQTRIPPAALLRESSLLRPAKEVPLYQQRPRQIEASLARRGEADARKKVKTRSVCRVCKVSCMFILLTNLIFVIIVGIIIFNGGLDFLTLP